MWEFILFGGHWCKFVSLFFWFLILPFIFELLKTACSSYLLSIASGSVGNFLTNSLKLVNIDDMHMILICTMGLKSRSPHSVKSCLFVGFRPRFRSIKSHQWLHPSGGVDT